MDQPVTITFSQGLDTKTDPKQVPVGKFLSLTNMIFQKGGQLQKRNGYPYLSQNVPPSSSNSITTLSGNLVAIGETISAYSENTNQWVTNGVLQPCEVSVLPVVRNSVNQVFTDSATADGLVCCVYTQQYGTTTGEVTSYLFTVSDAVTGQTIVNPTTIPVISGGTITGSSRVCVMGGYFVIVSQVEVSSTTYLQYFNILTANPKTRGVAVEVSSSAYVPLSSNPGWDMVVYQNYLVVAFNTTTGGQGVDAVILSLSEIIATESSVTILAFTGANYVANLLSICVDSTTLPTVFYINFYNTLNLTAYCAGAFLSNGILISQFAPVAVATGLEGCLNITAAAQFTLCNIYYEIQGSGFGNSIIFIEINNFGSFFFAGVVVRGLGLASKAFYYNNQIYFLAAFSTPLQPSYFLMNATLEGVNHPVVTAKLAYQNGGGYLTLGLPSVTILGNTASFSYLFKDDVYALNTTNTTSQITQGGVYSQLGVNQASIALGTQVVSTSEIAQDLHLSGGFLSMYDGFFPVEHNFFVFPEGGITAVYAELQATPTGTFSSGSYTITIVSSSGTIYPGMVVSDVTHPSYITAGTQVQYVNGSTVTLTQPTVGAGTADSLLFTGSIAAQPDGVTNVDAYAYIWVYEWTDMKGNPFYSAPSVPIFVTTTGFGSDTVGSVTLQCPYYRITQKLNNPPTLVLYRWSAKFQNYYQVTSINAPLLNDVTQDAVTYVDTLPDSQVIGNNLLYTTGGVVPDTNGPASNIMTLFDTRLFMVDAEDPNVLWLSKTVVEDTPVEMSSDFTIYVAPNIGTTQSTGPMTAIFPMDDKLIIFKKNSIFYMNGTGPDNLGTTSLGSPIGNYSQPTFITSVVGCTNQQSIVLMPDGLMFQSDKGIWLLNRSLGTEYIGAPVEQYNSSLVTSARVKPLSNYVLFGLITGETLMYDYYYKQWGTFTGLPTMSSCIYNDADTILTPHGIQQETPGIYADGGFPVVMSFVTSWINLAGIQGYQRFREFYLIGNYLSPHKLALGVAYDYNLSSFHNSLIKPNNFSSVTPGPFGVNTPVGATMPLEQFRIHAKKQLCQSFQLSFQEIYDGTLGVPPGAGLTLSGLTCKIDIVRSTYPIRGSLNVG